MYKKIEYTAPTAVKGTGKKTTKRTFKERPLAELEAFGPRGMTPKEFYSKHNLEVKYQTRNPLLIVMGRLRTARDYGYDPVTYHLTPADKVALLHLDYLDALLMSYRERVRDGLKNKEYMENLRSKWTWKDVMDKEWKSRPAPRMLSNFTHTMASAGLMLKGLSAQSLPEFVLKWAKDLQKQLEEEMAFYLMLKGAYEEEIKNQMSKI